jgi:hypothetical protein
MRSTLRPITLIAALAALIPTLVAQEKDKDKAKPESKESLAKLQQVAGTLVNPGSEKGNIVLSVAFTEPYRSGNRIHYRQAHKNVDFAPADDMFVRRTNPPVAYDDKGKPRKQTPKELKELKGDGNLPGYQAELSDLKKDQAVVLYLQAAKKPAKKDDADALKDSKPRVRMIMIVREP